MSATKMASVAVRKRDGWTGFLVKRFRHTDSRAEPALGHRGVPCEHVAFGDDDVGVAVAGEIEEPQVGFSPIDVRLEAERLEDLPVLRLGPLEETCRRALEHDAVEPAVASRDP